MEIDYTKYTHAELLDVKDSIDAEKHPDRYNAILNALNNSESKQWSSQPILQFEKHEQDPVARTTEWVPLKSGGSNFKTHRLVHKPNSVISFAPTIGLYLFSIFFCGFSLVMFWKISLPFFLEGTLSNELGNIIFAIVPLVFVFASAKLISLLFTKTIFDKKRAMFWTGLKAPARYRSREAKNSTSLVNIHALQLISEYCSDNDGDNYYSYELNLVLKNGNRINVVDHGNYNALRVDADYLAKFLGISVWEATDNRKQSWIERIFSFRN